MAGLPPVVAPMGLAKPTSANSQHPITSKASQNTTPQDWDSERQLVLSLWKLQQLEAKIHKLRTLLPGRVLAPLIPIVGPLKAGIGRSSPQSPQLLYEQLSQSARDGVAEIEQFKSTWRSPEIKIIWDRVDEKLKESDGNYPQTCAKWERDYDVILQELDSEERENEKRRQKDEETQERLKVLSSSGGWKGVVESFRKRGLPGIRILPGKLEATMTVVLLQSSIVFEVQQIINQEVNGSFEWQALTKQPQGRPKTKLETAIVACLNSRARKWDLAYLLEMIYSYSGVKQTRCKKCERMTDSTAQLPTVRAPKLMVSPDGIQSLIWEPYHPGCT